MLLATHKTILIKHAAVYLTIGNLSYKIWRSWSKLEEIIVGLNLIHKRDSLEIKMEIYY